MNKFRLLRNTLYYVILSLLITEAYSFCYKTEVSQLGSVASLDFSFNNNTFLSLDTNNKTLYFWHLSNFSVISKYTNFTGGNSPNFAKFSKDGTLVGIGMSNGDVIVISGTAFTYIRTFSTSNLNPIVEIDFSWGSSNEILVCGGNRFGVYSNTGTYSWGGNLGATVIACKLNKADDVGVSYNPKNLRWYTNQSSAIFTDNSNQIYNDIDFSPNLTSSTIRLLAACQDSKGYQFYYTASGSMNQIVSLNPLKTTSYSKDGKYYLFGTDGGKVYVYNSTSFGNSLLQVFTEGATSTTGLWLVASRFSYDSNYFAVGNTGGNIFIYSANCMPTTCQQGYYSFNNSCYTCSILTACGSCTSSTVCTNCMQGYYLNGNICSTCTIINACRDCKNNTYCYQCIQGYYLNSGNSCTLCVSNNTGCASCYRYAINDTFKCTHCQNQYYLNATDYLCYPCNINNTKCLRCWNVTACAECEMGYYSGPALTCLNCPTNCLICSNSTLCKVCSKGYYSNNTLNYTCTQCPVGCLDCFSSSLCLNCAFSYYRNNGTCTSCPLPCIACNSTTQCYTCQQGYYINNGTCLSCSGCLTCNTSTNCLSCVMSYYLSTAHTCLSCSNLFYQCQTCNQTTCFSCQIAFTINSTSNCSLCSDNIVGCSICSSTSTCLGCQHGFYLNGAACSRCNGNCTACINATNCLSCTPGYYLSTTCIVCPAPCSTCSAVPNCLSCNIGYFLDSSFNPKICSKCPSAITGCQSCTSATVCQACQVGRYLAAGGASCIQCSNFCSTCNSTTCYSCSSGYYLSSGLCVKCQQTCSQCISATNCSSCNVGYFYNSTLASNQCSACTLTNCSTCNSTTCFTCQIGTYLNSTACPTCYSKYNNCRTCSPTTCDQCLYGYYLNSGSCSICTPMEGCLSCWSNLNCSECSIGYYLVANGTCSTCPSKCKSCSNGICTACSPRFTFNSLQNDCLLCQSYIFGCEYCSSNSTCINCREGYYFSAGTCLDCYASITGCLSCNSSSLCTVCQSQYYFNGSACQSCQLLPGCSLCNSSSVCLSCQNGYYLFNNSCSICSVSLPGCLYCLNTSTCKVCQTGYFLNNVTNQCSLCINSLAGCIQCFNSTKCLQCDGGYFLNSTTLLCNGCNQIGCQVCAQTSSTLCVSCSMRYYLSGTACLSCNQSGCLQCSNSTLCLNCQAGYYLSAGMCSQCSSSITACSKCLNSTVCQQCHSLFYLNSTSSCSLCSLTLTACQTCFNNTFCSSCVSGFYQLGGACFGCTTITGCFMCISSTQCSSCVSGYYLSVTSCLSCTVAISNCFECSNSTICHNCKSGYKLNANSGCDQIKVSGSSAPDPIPQITVKTYYVSANELKHIMEVKQGYTYNQLNNITWSTSATISLYNSATNNLITLAILRAEWGRDGNTLVFYTNNPINISQSSFEMPMVRLLLSGSDFGLSYQTNFQLSKDTLSQILPDMVFTNDLTITQPLLQPSFYMSLLQNSGDNYFMIFGIVIVSVLFLNFIIKATCTSPLSKNQGEIIPHILSFKTLTLMVFPLYPQVVNFCAGLMSSDFPWLSYTYTPSLSVSSDLSPAGFQLYYSNMNFASVYFTAFIAMLILLLLGYLSISQRTNKQQDEVFSLSHAQPIDHQNVASYAYLNVILNFFSFGIVFAGAVSLQGALYNPFELLSINGFFYMLGTAVYFIMLGIVIAITKRTKQTCLARSFIKATILSMAHISPIYIVTLAVAIDLVIIIVQFYKYRQQLVYPKVWLFNNTAVNLALLSCYYFNNIKLVLLLSISVLFLIVLFQLFMHIDEGSDGRQQVEERREKVRKNEKLETIDFLHTKFDKDMQKNGTILIQDKLNQSKTTFKDTSYAFNNTNYSKISDWDFGQHPQQTTKPKPSEQFKPSKKGQRRTRRFNNTKLQVDKVDKIQQHGMEDALESF